MTIITDLITPLERLLNFVLNLINGIGTFLIDSLVLGFFHFFIGLLLFIPALFLIMELFILAYAVFNTNRDPNKSAFTLIRNLINGHISTIKAIGQILKFIIDLTHGIINSIVPV